MADCFMKSNQPMPYMVSRHDLMSWHHRQMALAQIERLEQMLAKLQADLERIMAHETHEKLEKGEVSPS